MIFIITGKTGHGKSAYMAKIARGALLQGKRIYSNIKLNPEFMFSKRKLKKTFEYENIEGDITLEKDRNDIHKRILYWQNFSDWQYFENGVVFVDEGLVYFNARKWEALPDSMQMKFVQHRKDKVDLIFNVQHYTFIEKTLRVLCERFINVELKIGSSRFKKSIIPRISRIIELDLPTLNRCENLGIDPYNVQKEEAERYNIKAMHKEWFWIKTPIFKWYDTSVKVLPSRPEPLMHNQRVCNFPGCGKINISHT